MNIHYYTLTLKSDGTEIFQLNSSMNDWRETPKTYRHVDPEYGYTTVELKSRFGHVFLDAGDKDCSTYRLLLTERDDALARQMFEDYFRNIIERVHGDMNVFAYGTGSYESERQSSNFNDTRRLLKSKTAFDF